VQRIRSTADLIMVRNARRRWRQPAMRCRKEANSPAPWILIALRCCRHRCRRSGSARSLDRRRGSRRRV